MLSTLASLLAIAYLPGAIIFRLPIADRAKRAALPAEERVFWSVVISVIVTTTLAFLLAAMSAYSLAALVWCNVALAAGVAAASLGRLRLGSTARRPGWTALIPIALIALGAWMYFAVPAAEYVLGGRDPGVYVSQGIQIAQRQSLVTRDHVAAAVPEGARDLFFPSYGDAHYYSLRFMGFHLRDPDAGTVTGQFPQGYPVWIAIAYGLDGVTGTRRVIAWWAILGILTAYFAARRLIGPIPAAAAAGLLCVHVIQTWYARYPNSEIVTQALLFSALLAHAYSHQDEDRFFGPVAASLLGIALFTRLPTVFTIAAVVIASLLTHVDGHRLRAGFLVTLAGWVAAAAVYYLTQLRPYFGRPIEYVGFLQPIHLATLALAGLAACGMLWASRTPSVAAAIRRWLPVALIAAVIVGGVYALYFREPRLLLALHDAYAVRMFADLYFTRIAFGLALAGYALVVWRTFWRAPAMILAVTGVGGFFFYKMRIYPEHFWLARRFIPDILPAALIFAAATLFAPLWLTREHSTGKRRIIGTASVAVGAIGVALLGSHYMKASTAIRTHIEYANVIPNIERLAKRFRDDDLVLVESRTASDVHTLALPLSYIWARNVLVLASSRPDKRAFAEFLDWAREKYHAVYFIGAGGTDLLSRGVAVEAFASERFAVPEFESTSSQVYPTHARTKPFDFTVYRFGPQSAPEESRFRLDVGGEDDLHLVQFHAKEHTADNGTTYRWTQDQSFFSVLNLQPADRELVLRMSNGGRPTAAAPARVTVYLSEHSIGTADPDAQFRDYVFAIPPEIAQRLSQAGGSAEVRVESTTWTPREVIGGVDDRRLGVMVDRAEIR